MKEACQAVTLSRMSPQAILDVTGKVEEKLENHLKQNGFAKLHAQVPKPAAIND